MRSVPLLSDASAQIENGHAAIAFFFVLAFSRGMVDVERKLYPWLLALALLTLFLFAAADLLDDEGV